MGTRPTSLFETPEICTDRMKRDELQRELDMRARVYKRQVLRHKMSQADADRRIWIIECIIREGYSP
jgi:hypothetical protein